MTFTNQGNGASSGGGGQITFSEGALLTPSAGVITPTDSFHHVAAGTISSIATTNFDSGSAHFLILEANGALTFTAGANLVVNRTTAVLGDVILFRIEGTVVAEVGMPPFAFTAWTAVTFSAGNFTADVGSWTLTAGDQLVYGYKIVGDLMLVAGTFNTTTVAGNPNELRVAIPASKTSSSRVDVPATAKDNGTAAHAKALVSASGQSVIKITRVDAATWAAATDTTLVSFEIWIPIN